MQANYSGKGGKACTKWEAKVHSYYNVLIIFTTLSLKIGGTVVLPPPILSHGLFFWFLLGSPTNNLQEDLLEKVVRLLEAVSHVEFKELIVTKPRMHDLEN